MAVDVLLADRPDGRARDTVVADDADGDGGAGGQRRPLGEPGEVQEERRCHVDIPRQIDLAAGRDPGETQIASAMPARASHPLRTRKGDITGTSIAAAG